MYVTRRSDNLEYRVKKGTEALEHLLAPWAGKGTPSVLAELMRRGEQPFGADGYATTSALDPSGVSANSELTSVEGAASARMADKCSRCDGTGKGQGRGKCRACNGSGKRWADPVADSVTIFLKELGVALRALAVVDAQVDSVMGSAAKLAGRQSSLQGTCQVAACGATVSGVGNDRLRGGFCHRCYLKLTTWRLLHPTSSDPGADRQGFIIYMGEWLAERAQKEREKAEREAKEIERLRRRGELPTARVR